MVERNKFAYERKKKYNFSAIKTTKTKGKLIKSKKKIKANRNKIKMISFKWEAFFLLTFFYEI